eukprot:gene9800-20388_t
MAYYYLVTSLKPTAVQNAVVCNFTGGSEKNLIICRGNRLEIHTLCSEGLLPIFEAGLYGRIVSLVAFRPPTLVQDVLFILTDRKHFSVLSFDSSSKKLVTRATGNLRDKVGRDLESGSFGLIDPDNRVIGIFLYEGLMKVISILNNGLADPFNVRIDELKLIDVKFLYGCLKPTMCILYEDNRGCRHVKTYVVGVREKELCAGPWQQNNVEHGAKIIIPVPSPSGGILLIGQSTLTYLSGTGKTYALAMQYGALSSYGSIDTDGSRYLLGDSFGTLFVLVLHRDFGAVTGLSLDILGTTSTANSLCYLDNGVVFVGSQSGDSQLVKLLEKRDEHGSHVEVLQAYPNIGPILDMCVVESDRQGQSQVVTCSGAHKDGSLRVIRSGIGIEEQASIEIQGIKGIWSLRSHEKDVYDKFLVQAFIGETRVLCMEDDQLVEAEIPGFSSGQTLHCGNMLNGLIVQVTQSTVRLIASDSLRMVNEVNVSPKRITGASSTPEQVVLSLSGGEVLYLELDVDGHKGTPVLQLVGTLQMDYDVACMSLRPLTHGDDEGGGGVAMNVEGGSTTSQTTTTISSTVSESHLSSGRSRLLAVAMWTDASVRLLALPVLQEVGRTSLGVDTQARDLLLVEMHSVSPMLLVGLGDGTLLIYTIDFTSGLPNLVGRRKVVVGSQPISFSFFTHADALCVFMSGDRPTVVYSKNGKVLFSVANVSKVTGLAPFHTELFPECLAMSSESGLRIGTVDDIQKVHIQSFHLGESPRRICHSYRSGIYAVCTQRTVCNAESGDETNDRVLFLEEGTMQQQHAVDLEPFEMAISCICCQVHVDTVDGTGVVINSKREVVIVGTSFSMPEEYEPSRGRLLVFELAAERPVSLMTQREVKGAVYSIGTLDGKIIAGIGSKVQLFKWMPRDDPIAPPELQPEASYKGCILALYIKTHGDFIVVGDLMRSVTLLHYRSMDGTLEEVARDYNANYMRAVEALDEDFALGCEDLGNLFVVKRQTDATTEEERSRMEVHAEIHLGDYVNVFRHGSLNSQPAENDLDGVGAGSPTQKSVLFGTVTGALGAIMTLSEASFRFFSALERAVNLVIPGVGGLSHSEWRSFFNNRKQAPQRNFVDGDMVEIFLDLKEEDMALAVRHLNGDLASSLSLSSSSATVTEGPFSVDDVVRRVEEMSLYPVDKVCMTGPTNQTIGPSPNNQPYLNHQSKPIQLHSSTTQTTTSSTITTTQQHWSSNRPAPNICTHQPIPNTSCTNNQQYPALIKSHNKTAPLHHAQRRPEYLPFPAPWGYHFLVILYVIVLRAYLLHRS